MGCWGLEKIWRKMLRKEKFSYALDPRGRGLRGKFYEKNVGGFIVRKFKEMLRKRQIYYAMRGRG